MSATAASEQALERDAALGARDGWRIHGRLYVPESAKPRPGVVLVHGSRHESDAFGNISSAGLPNSLRQHDVGSLRIDIRGRGLSSEPALYHALTPLQREAVALDIEAAIDFLAEQPGVNPRRIGLVGEQDTADAAVLVAAEEPRVAAVCLISARLSAAAKEAVPAIRAPLFCLVGKEDKRSFRDMTDAYLSSKNRNKRLVVFEGVGIGTTMFATWDYEHPDEESIQDTIGNWLAGRLEGQARKVSGRRRKNR